MLLVSPSDLRVHSQDAASRTWLAGEAGVFEELKFIHGSSPFGVQLPPPITARCFGLFEAIRKDLRDDVKKISCVSGRHFEMIPSPKSPHERR